MNGTRIRIFTAISCVIVAVISDDVILRSLFVSVALCFTFLALQSLSSLGLGRDND